MPRIMAIGGLGDCGCSKASKQKPLRAGRHGGGSVGSVSLGGLKGTGTVVLEGRPRGTRGLGRGRVCVEIGRKVRCFKSAAAAERALAHAKRRKSRR